MDVLPILKALGDENRLRIYNVLRQKKACVCELETILSLNQANVSRHLSKLRTAGILNSEKEGQWIKYFVRPSFEENEAELIAYLDKKLANTEVIRKDNGVLAKYFEHCITCVDIKQVPKKVHTILHD